MSNLDGNQPITPYATQVSLGSVAGSKPVNKFGKTTNLDSGVVTTIWDGSNTPYAL